MRKFASVLFNLFVVALVLCFVAGLIESDSLVALVRSYHRHLGSYMAVVFWAMVAIASMLIPLLFLILTEVRFSESSNKIARALSNASYNARNEVSSLLMCAIGGGVIFVLGLWGFASIMCGLGL